MKKQLLRSVLVFLSLLSGAFFWLSIHRAIMFSGSSDWMVPIIWFSILYIFLSLLFVIESRSFWSLAPIVLIPAVSLLFVPEIVQGALVVLAILFLWSSYFRVRSDLKENIRINLVKSLRLGRLLFILALSLVISGQYFFESQRVGKAEEVPEVDFSGFLSSSWTDVILQKVSPSFSGVSQEGFTVDEFLEKNYQSSYPSGTGGPLSGSGALEKSEALEAGREQLSELVGRQVSGQETIAEVFSEMVNRRIAETFSPQNPSGEGDSLFSGILSLVLFLTVFSLGLFLAEILAYLIQLIFWTLKKLRLVEIVQVPVEMEVIR